MLPTIKSIHFFGLLLNHQHAYLPATKETYVQSNYGVILAIHRFRFVNFNKEKKTFFPFQLTYWYLFAFQKDSRREFPGPRMREEEVHVLC